MKLENLDALRKECELNPDYWTAFQELTGDPGKHIRNLTRLNPQTVCEAVATIRIGKTAENKEGRQLAPIDAGRIGLMWRITKHIAFTKDGKAWGDFVDTDPMLPDNPPIFEERMPPPVASTLATLPDASIAGGGSSVMVPLEPTLIQGKINTSLVLDQGDESEVAMPDQKQIAIWENNYI